ncbi:aspartate ammonia-lyase [Georgenia sp. SUBG003]|uniref:aspartate ammonia-lyase n=1 Tax=Georgenia sp. SUBG003 TaxID=1497974 RepID=UPI0004D7BFEA|nr:aspartate ammonia-lyase [Georgenia sp. SUBG003]
MSERLEQRPVAALRLEHDQLGAVEVPAGALYGAHTARAVANFPISGVPVGRLRELVVALAEVKQAAARTNRALGLLEEEVADAISAACAEIVGGSWHDHFVVDCVQGGAGTSTNMNANEVVANRALELLGHPRGAYSVVHPLDSVNKSQSTNDVYPTALRLAAHRAVGRLIEALRHLQGAFTGKATEFTDVVTIGRTQLQDAVPVSLGHVFAAYAVTLGEDCDRLTEVRGLLEEINLGGTAVGTGLNTDPRYASVARGHLSAITGIPLRTSPDLIEATQDTGVFVLLSGTVKRTAVKLSKISNDLRLLSSGPRAGIGDITLPAVQAGSSIMPGKVNPVIPEVVNQVAYGVIGNDLTITMAAEAGQLQLNAFEPVIIVRLLESLSQLTAASRVLADRCVAGISVDRDELARKVRHSIGLATALGPLLGHGEAAAVAREALATGQDVPSVALAQGLLSPEVLDRALAPQRLARPHG